MLFTALSINIFFLPLALAIDEDLFLSQFGYLPNIPNALLSEDVKNLAVRRFQRAYGLQITGNMNQETRRAMDEPRCSVSDFETNSPQRRKRSISEGWQNNSVSYGFHSWSNHLPPGTIEHIVRRAFDVWEKEADISFHRSTKPQITIEFGPEEHNCSSRFSSSVLAHAFPPSKYNRDIDGDVHFNDLHRWIGSEYSSLEGVSLLAVATHEIGHALGLTHNVYEADSIMSPRDKHSRARITERDRYYLQSLYGPPKTKSKVNSNSQTTTTENPITKQVNSDGTRKRNNFHESTIKPNPCNTDVDAVGVLRGNFFLFKDEWVWRFAFDGSLLQEPTLITSVIPQLSYPVDAVLEVQDDLWIFVGDEVFIVHITPQGLRIKHAPYHLTNFDIQEGVKQIDLAYVWHYDPYVWYYIWSGSKYWKINITDRKVEKTYPRLIERNWKNVPQGATAAFSFNKELHFIKDQMIYRMNTSDFRLPIDKDYPMWFSDFFQSCPKNEIRYSRLRPKSASISLSFLTILIFSFFVN